MKFLLVDDERLALLQLEKMIATAFQDHYSSIDSFQLVSKAIEWAKVQQPDIICLDVNMPEMCGLEAAERFQKLCPNAEIIFVTAYDEYALKAFELNAIDYLLKPITQQRLQKTAARLFNRYKFNRISKVSDKPDYHQRIYCFNNIKLGVGKELIEKPKWRTSKAQELFAYLLHHRGELVPKYEIINLFTPELDKKRAMTQLYTTVYQIRKYMKDIGFQMTIHNDSIQEGYSLKLENTWIDIEAWEKQIDALQPSSESYYTDIEDLLQQYEGDYLGEYNYWWAEGERERLRQLWIHHAHILLHYFYKHRQWMKLILLSEEVHHYSPFELQHALYLLEAYEALGQYDKLKGYIQKQRVLYKEELDLPLPEEIEDWYRNWVERRKSYT